MVSIPPKNETANHKNKQFNRNKATTTGIMSRGCGLIFLVAVLMMGVLVLDAYEYISVQVAKDARTTLYATIQDIDPAIIEQQIGMKILSLEEYNKIVNEAALTKEQHKTLTNEVVVVKADLEWTRQAIVQEETLVTTLVTERDAIQGQVSTMVLERDTLASQLVSLNSEKDTLSSQLVTLTTERDAQLQLLALQKVQKEQQQQQRQQQQAAELQKQVNVEDKIEDVNANNNNQECILDEQSSPETIAAALFTNNCTVVTCATAFLADQIMAFVPNYRYHQNNKINDDNVIVELQRDDNYTWLALDWRQRQGITFPFNSAPCNPSTTWGRHLNYYFGSGLFTDMTYLLYSRRPYYRFLDASKETGDHVYLSTLYDQQHDDQSSSSSQQPPAMRALRKCLKQHGADRTNAIACLFLPTTDCVLTIPNNDNTATIPTANKEIIWSKAPDHISQWNGPKERYLCGVVGQKQDGDAGDDEYKNECLRNQVGRAIPTSPILERALKPDISKMALFLAGRELEMAAPLRAAVHELLQAQPVLPSLPCVAVHIRRGDKLPECGFGIQDSCQFHKNWTDYSDIGVDYLKQLNAIQGSTGGTMFVMTDDAAFLQGKTVPAPYQVVGLAGNTAPDLAHADGLRDLAILMASFELASRCDALVGNSASEVFEVMLILNCIRRGSCPSVHSINGNATLSFAVYIADGRASTVSMPPL